MRGPVRSAASGVGRDGLVWRLMVAALGLLGFLLVPGVGAVSASGPAAGSMVAWSADGGVRAAVRTRSVAASYQGRQSAYAGTRTETLQAVAGESGTPFAPFVPLLAVLPVFVLPARASWIARSTIGLRAPPAGVRPDGTRCRAPPTSLRT